MIQSLIKLSQQIRCLFKKKFELIDDQLKVSDWQIAKKAYHGQKGFGLDLDKYDNITKDDLDKRWLN